MKHILMVCLGNICRSPLAESILRSKVDSETISIDSAGTGDYHIGDPPDDRSVATARKYGIDISNLRGRQFSSEDFNRFDLIYVMDESNYANVLKLAPTEGDKQKVKFILNEVYPDQDLNVPDPYWGNMADFENVYKMLDEACERIMKKL